MVCWFANPVATVKFRTHNNVKARSKQDDDVGGRKTTARLAAVSQHITALKQQARD
jgi:hypothetical protein